MSNLENKLKKIIDTFNNVNRDIAFKDIKKLSEKYNKNISVQNILYQISMKFGDIDTSINALNKNPSPIISRTKLIIFLIYFFVLSNSFLHSVSSKIPE